MRIGIALSGGGVRAMAHLGAIKALEELGIKFNCISGTSAGALVGSLYAYGYSPDDVLKIISTTSFWRSFRPAWRLPGLLRLDTLHDILYKYIPENSFELLKIPLTVVATEIRKGRSEYFITGELIPAVLSSCCVPAIFNPIQFNGGVYVDGGILDNLPARSIRDKCDFLIGSHCNYLGEKLNLGNLRMVLERSLLMAVSNNTINSKNICNFLIEPQALGKYSGFELSKAKEIFDVGYDYIKNNFTIAILNEFTRPND